MSDQYRTPPLMASATFRSPVTMDVSAFSSQSIPKQMKINTSSRLSTGSMDGMQKPKSPLPGAMEFPKDTSPDMIPILTLLTCHECRDYYDGYFMILSDLNTGKFVPALLCFF
jgi:hypothetical protein